MLDVIRYYQSRLQSVHLSFRNILIISHVDAIKDSVDNSLEILKNGKDSKLARGRGGGASATRVEMKKLSQRKLQW